jgi:hypothetical protein
MANFIWTGGARNGLFDAAKNWLDTMTNAAGVPGAGDTAEVPEGVTATITSKNKAGVNILSMLNRRNALTIDNPSTFAITNTDQPGTLLLCVGGNFSTYIEAPVFSNYGVINVQDGSTLNLAGNEFDAGTISLLAKTKVTQLVLTGATALYPAITYTPARLPNGKNGFQVRDYFAGTLLLQSRARALSSLRRSRKRCGSCRISRSRVRD